MILKTPDFACTKKIENIKLAYEKQMKDKITIEKQKSRKFSSVMTQKHKEDI
jgi:hypothetical protein